MNVALKVGSLLDQDSNPKEHLLDMIKGLRKRNFTFYVTASTPDLVRLIAAGVYSHIETKSYDDDTAIDVVITDSVDEAHECIAENTPVLLWDRTDTWIKPTASCSVVSNWWDIYQHLCTIQSHHKGWIR
ncbi:hypothetical protein ACK8P5_26575 (plasmid) [Paenibacillus sp. EC2-1]|uniref:hypothetical protein n=1 Tax=Paenibacillus sp. EC2-1 TaxID=3388665 RepID=UPI003BEF210E